MALCSKGILQVAYIIWWERWMTGWRGEKIGWIGGFTGGYVWVVVLSVVFLLQGRLMEGLSGICLVGVALGCVIRFAPWRFPSTAYWKLMLIPYGIFCISIIWAVWAFGGFKSVAAAFAWWEFVWMVPVLLPFGVIGTRRWSDHATCRAVSDTEAPPRG